MSRRAFLRVGLSAGVLGLGGLAGLDRLLAGGATPRSRLDEFARNIISGGPPKDGIPPIDRPKYVSATEAETSLRPNDVVFGLDYKGTVKAFPQIILVWHEIVNDEVAGDKLSITYCPLTGSTVAYRGESKVDGKPFTFGTSGNLVNSNLLMYDRQTDGNWPQILGVAINGPTRGQPLDTVPVVWTAWERWKRRYPNTLVLSRETGHLRAYGRDPYGSYTSDAPNYYTSGGPFFPVMAKSSRFPDKKVVIGVKVQDDVLALLKDAATAARVVNLTLGGRPLVALYDADLDEVFAYDRQVDGRELVFRRSGQEIVDEQSATVWTAQGQATRGKLAGARLRWTTSFDVMWFAWYAFYPDAKVLVPQ